jgi:hypothetical protein
MNTTNHYLINELLSIIENCLGLARQFQTLDEKTLNYRPAEKSWSILECLEHLNLYGDFYLPEIEKCVMKGRPYPSSSIFSSGRIGNYFANLMKVKKDGTIKKMKSPGDKNPLGSDLNSLTVDRFIKQLERLQQLLEDCRYINLTELRTPISLTRLIKLRLGDTLRFLVYHIERHTVQALNVERNLAVPNRENAMS